MNRSRGARIGARWMGVALSLALVGAACGDDDSDGPSGSAAAPTSSSVAASTSPTTAAPKRGGTITFVHTIEPRGYDPVLSNANTLGGDGAQMSAVFDVLVYEDPNTGEIIPRTADSFTSTDGVTWTIKLRPNVRFSDGTPYDAEAVKFNFERHMDPANRSSGATQLSGVASMTVSDPLTLVITLKEGNGQFPRGVAKSIPFIASPTALRERGAEFATNPVGAGPFLLKEWIRDSRATFVRNPNYWDAPRPHIDELVVTRINDPEQAYNTLVTNGAQIANMSSVSHLVDRGRKAGFPALESPNPTGAVLYLQLNMQKPPFDDLRARQAVVYGMNLKQLNDTVFQGLGEVPTHPIRPPSPFHDPEAVIPQYDTARAQRLIDEYVAATGRELEFEIAGSTNSVATQEFLQAQMSQFRNVKVTTKALNPAEVVPTFARGDFQAGTFAHQGSDPEPGFYDSYHTGASRNYRKYSNPEVDAALERARKSLDVNERKAAYQTVQRAILRDFTDVWLSSTPRYFLFQPSVKGLDESSISPLWWDVWLDR